ncbi:MAG: FGGY-family carbohydrate kinase [Actinomycetota bacterium]|nr:FGGY-family carbohydrate kinase [Actinomycetota bacterium]
MEHVLGLDLGTSGLKLALVTVRGQIVASALERYPLHLLPHGGAEQDPEDWWGAVVRGTRRVMGASGADPASVIGVGCSSQWSGTVPVDADGRPLTRAIIWMDSRGAEQIRRIVRGFPMVQGYGLGKLVAWIRRTGGAPGHQGKDSIAHVLFVREHLPAIHQRTHLFLEPRDWINFRLSGRMVTSSDAVTLHWVADARDVNDVRYDRKLLRMAGLDRSKLPDIVPAASVLGPLRAEAAAELGLPGTAQVVTGAPDNMAAAIGAGAVRDFDAHLCLGTSSWLSCHVPYKKTDLFHNMASLPSAIPGRYFLANEQESAGVCLVELKENVLFPPDAGPHPEDPYGTMLALAEAAPAGSDGLIFAPWVNGERTPVDDRTARGGFFNQSLGVTRGHLVRAVLEGVAYNSRWLLTYVEKFIKRRLDAITVVGGGARSELWCQVVADVLDRTILQSEDPVLANARGAALQASVALGRLTWDEVAGSVPVARTFQPDPHNRAVYDAQFREFLNLYKATRKIHARLNANR